MSKFGFVRGLEGSRVLVVYEGKAEAGFGRECAFAVTFRGLGSCVLEFNGCGLVFTLALSVRPHP